MEHIFLYIFSLAVALVAAEDSENAQDSDCAEFARRGLCGGLTGVAGSEPLRLCSRSCAVANLKNSNATSKPELPGAGVTNSPTPSDPPAAGGSRWFSDSCPVLLALPGGCSHDLSQHDPTRIPAGTHVSDLCHEECSGHAGCAAAALDAGFLWGGGRQFGQRGGTHARR